jgi:hypothetical protein
MVAENPNKSDCSALLRGVTLGDEPGRRRGGLLREGYAALSRPYNNKMVIMRIAAFARLGLTNPSPNLLDMAIQQEQAVWLFRPSQPNQTD